MGQQVRQIRNYMTLDILIPHKTLLYNPTNTQKISIFQKPSRKISISMNYPNTNL